MLSTNIFIPLAFFFLLYLGLQAVKGNLFLVYLVQLKEYRLDRIVAYCKTLTGKKQLIHYLTFLTWRRPFRPKFTFRVLLIFGLTFFAQYNVFFFVLRVVFRMLKNFSFSIVFSLIITLFLINLITPLIILLLTCFTFLFSLPIKKTIIFLAKRKKDNSKNLLVIGVTGSYGKTAVKEILSFVLADFFKVLKTPANCNTLIGIASLILRKLRSSHDIFVVEMGAYKRGEIKAICELVKPKVGIVTGINKQHIELFGSLSNIQWAKFELIKSLPKDGLAIFNAASPKIQRLIKATKINKKVYGQKKFRLKIKLKGNWHQQNIQAALLVGDYLGISRQRLYKRMAKLKDFPLALKEKKGVKGAKIIDDSYSANPTGFLAALDMLAKTKAKTKILVTPGIIELGKKSAEVHRQIGEKAGRVCHKIFLTKADFKKPILEGIGIKNGKDLIEVEEDDVELFQKIKPFLDKKTVILLEGRLPAYLKKRLIVRK